jgi:XTP/dITP diphosphohydrolase
MLRVVLASNNRGKLAEMTALLVPYQVQVLPLSQFTNEAVEETGDTFIANALLKARHASQVSGLPAIADDSGIEVDALHGAPGVYSARYAGEPSNDAANNAKLLTLLTNISDAQRGARFRCVLAYVRSANDANPVLADAAWEGRVLHAPRGEHGFGYDSLFLPQGSELSAAEMTRDEKNRVSHRAQAMRLLLQQLQASGQLLVNRLVR